ncbi:hypothetical protein ACLKA7_014689 [Drosophila subpalustris]
MSDRKVKVREIADILKISAGSVHTIIHEHLGMKKVFSKWVPRLLTPEQKQQRIDESKSCLDMFTRNKSEFLRRYITMDETWIHHFTPESNRQSAEWHAAGESRPKRPKTQQLAGKVVASIFWDAHGIIFIDYLQKGQTINSDYYMALLERLKDEIAKKRPHMAKKKVLFHQDNAPCHKSMKTMAKLNELGFELLPHPPYSPDLAPSDYWLFADLKKMLRGDEEIAVYCSLQLCCFGWAHPEAVRQYERYAPFLELVMVELWPTLLKAERQQIVERTFEELPH